MLPLLWQVTSCIRQVFVGFGSLSNIKIPSQVFWNEMRKSEREITWKTYATKCPKPTSWESKNNNNNNPLWGLWMLKCIIIAVSGALPLNVSQRDNSRSPWNEKYIILIFSELGRRFMYFCNCVRHAYIYISLLSTIKMI